MIMLLRVRVSPFRVLNSKLLRLRSPPVFLLQQNSFSTLTHATKEVLEKHKEELISLRGTPELIDKLESLVHTSPGIEMDPELYKTIFPFKLDDFQLKGLNSLVSGNNVLVMTPTGSGKTVVGELAIYFSLMMGLQVIYTTPLKALSNQKFLDFQRKFGGDRVSLLTGELSINKGAPITVMTTEIFRNKLYNLDDLKRKEIGNIFLVCFDEFHYMNDNDRGTVWEESLISCPKEIRVLALSATIGNDESIRKWMTRIHGPTEVIKSSFRPVPLNYFYATKGGLLPFFKNPLVGPGAPKGLPKEKQFYSSSQDSLFSEDCDVNPKIASMDRKTHDESSSSSDRRKSRNGKDSRRNGKNSRDEERRQRNALTPPVHSIISELERTKRLPVIYFIFSRAGCEQAAIKLLRTMDKSLLTAEETDFVNEAIKIFVKLNPLIPIDVMFLKMLKRGICYHHAGLITQLKAFIEELFLHGKIKVLFATETLAAGK
jgi:superfamily II RNA helicase